jgi:hypothetical protein
MVFNIMVIIRMDYTKYADYDDDDADQSMNWELLTY